MKPEVLSDVVEAEIDDRWGGPDLWKVIRPNGGFSTWKSRRDAFAHARELWPDLKDDD